MDVIFDVDGTLSDPEHRRHHVSGGAKDWEAWRSLMGQDPVVKPVAVLARLLFALRHRVLLCTGRSEEDRAETEAWLARHGIRKNELYMRPSGDYRPDDVVKEELLEAMLSDGYRPELVFDDRASVVAMWRRRGLICAQVAPGNF